MLDHIWPDELSVAEPQPTAPAAGRARRGWKLGRRLSLAPPSAALPVPSRNEPDEREVEEAGRLVGARRRP
jgi:hypothetical protein